MSFGNDPVRESVPPPGWTEPATSFAPTTPAPAATSFAPTTPAPATTSFAPAALAPAATAWAPATPPPAATALASVPLPAATVAEPAEAAVRWRLRAARIDNLIVYGGYLLLCLLLHWPVASLTHLWVLAVGSVAYHLVLESRDGQTIGKRRYGIQVVSIDGSPASPQAILIRSVLRIVDQLPISYLSGLISMVRTGPSRRQRIGDVAAGTIVVATGGRAAARGTPRWFLPTAAVLSAAVSVLSVVGYTQARTRPLDSVQQAEFISNCENGAGGQVIDCQCLLNHLEAAGYDTPQALDDLVAQAEATSDPNAPNPARTAILNAGASCRR